MMSVMNVMCGNVEMECAYAVLKAFNIKRDERNIFEQIGQSCHMIHNRAPYHEKCFCPIVNVFRSELFFKGHYSFKGQAIVNVSRSKLFFKGHYSFKGPASEQSENLHVIFGLQ